MIRVVVVGLGRMGRNWARLLRDSPRFDLVATVDPYADDATRRDLYGCPAFDAAVVAAPTIEHANVSGALLETCRNVLVEKPLASTLRDAGLLVDRAAHAGASLVVGHVERFNPAARAFLAALKAGAAGIPIHLEAHRTGPRPATVTPGNTVALDLAVHDLDLLRLALGPLTVDAPLGRAPDFALAYLASSRGPSASLLASWLSPVRRRILRAHGTAGELCADLMAGTCALNGEPLAVHPGNALAAQIDAWATLVETGERGALCSAEDGAEAVRLAEMIG